MIIHTQLTVDVKWLSEVGCFFLWAETDDKKVFHSAEWKLKLFAWHSDSLYGTYLEDARIEGKSGIYLPADLAVSICEEPTLWSLQHSSFRFGEGMQRLQKTAALLRYALENGCYKPSLAKTGSTDRLSWTFILTEPFLIRCRELFGQSAAEFDEQDWPIDPEDWLNAALQQQCLGDGPVREAWSQLGQQYPALALAVQHQADEEEWLETIGWTRNSALFRIGLQLEEPADQANSWRLRPFLQDHVNVQKCYPCTEDGRSVLGPLPQGWREDDAARLIARACGKWLQLIPWLQPEETSGKPESSEARRSIRWELDDEEAWRFLEEGSDMLIRAGTPLFLPSWWEEVRSLKPRLRAALRPAAGSSGMLGLEQLMQFDWKLAIGGLNLSEEEFLRLLEQNRRLLFYRGRWIQLDPAWLAQLRAWLSSIDRSRGLSFREVLELYLLGGEEGDAADGADSSDRACRDGQNGESAEKARAASSTLRLEVELNEHLEHMMQQLQRAETMPEGEPPAGLHGSLRRYQQQGVSWLLFLRRFGLGACLADDMGLGKTIQFMSYLLHLQERGQLSAPALLICPTSVMGNWLKELERFAPSLKVYTHYGANRAKGEHFPPMISENDLVITTYTLAHLDEQELSSQRWSAICLDEAQNIKNALSKQSAAVRRLTGDHRIALTGTPIENRLSELWTLFDYMNPGYLGSQNRFRHRFMNPIEKEGNTERIAQVQRLIHPFLMRRVKKDPAIQLDLPEKSEMKVYVSLTAEQGALYENVVQDMLARIELLSPMERRGLIFAVLTKLKQICNHPALFLKESSAQSATDGRSNKISRLLEMVQEVRGQGERCLIFTQYLEMGRLLQEALEQTCGETTLFLHGGLSKAQRDRMIGLFQEETAGNSECPGIFILSLKAGGTGLNLTAANHVFHADRWWNPAVENQATDRAFRIGQTRDVQVHKFVTLGTLEERIDEMIERKQGLSQQIVGAGEGWISELSTGELKELFALRREWIDK